MTNYPLVNFQFLVDWGGGNTSFTEVTGLTMTNDVIEYRGGSSPEFHVVKMPGLRKFENIVLKRGVFKDDYDFYNWINTIKLNTVERRTITVSLMDETLTPILVWRIYNAWPCKLSYSHLKAGESHAMMEELEIAHEGWDIQNAVS